MIELAASVSRPSRTCMVAPAGGPAPDEFLALLAGISGGGATEPALTVIPGKRQAIAGEGKGLPDEMVDEDKPKEVSWLPAGLVPLVQVPAAVALAMPQPRVAPAPGGDGVSPLLTPAKTGVQSDELFASSPPSPDLAPASAGAQVTIEAQTSPVTKMSASRATTDGISLSRSSNAAQGDLLSRANVTVPASQQQPVSLPALTQPAGQAFATAIAVAIQARSHRGEREADSRAPLAIATAALEAVPTPAIAATPDARQGALDLRQDTGLQGMIDHIEVLRDGADANDTRIRLVPDALGAVDVSVRKDGERVHVHFAAENAASARLLNDAQPRLADLAEARGVKLGQTTVDSGGGDARQPPPTPFTHSPTPIAPRDSADIPTDHRVA